VVMNDDDSTTTPSLLLFVAVRSISHPSLPLGIVLLRPMTCLRHVNPTPIDFTLGFCIN
jgi:hypothetical protein